MQSDGLHTFDPIGITPPRGRQGHSVPTPKPLGVKLSFKSPIKGKLVSPTANQPFSSKLDSWPTTDLQQSSSSSNSSPTALSPAQFYTHRDHVFGGSLSKLDRMRSYPDSFVMEALDETEEYENGQLDDSKESVGKCPPSPMRVAPADSSVPNRRISTGASGHATNISLDKLTGDSLLSFSYSAASGGSGLNLDNQLGGSFVRAFTQGLSTSLSIPFFPSASPAALGSASGDQAHLFPTAARNPNKAIITIDAESSRILVANEMTCELFGYQRNELSGMKIQTLFTEPYRGTQRALMEQNISASGELVLISGKVMDAVTSYGIEFPVSVWMRRVGGDSSTQKADSTTKTPQSPPTPTPQTPPTPRVIVVIEPVERSSALFSMDSSHMIASCDPWFACLFGFQDSSAVIGKHITELIPSFKLPATMEELSKAPSKQAVTGRAKSGVVFPLTVKFMDVSQSLSIGDLYSPTHTSQQPSEGQLSARQSSETQPSEHSTQPPSDHQPSERSSSATDPVSTKSQSDTPSSPLTPPSTSPSSLSMTPPSTAPSMSATSDSVPGYVNAKVVVYAALSGMISFFLDGTIHGCNHHFALMLLGYTQQELLKKDITFLLPDFYQHIGFVDDRGMPLPPVDEEDLFHSVAERSFSPDRASDFIKNLQLQDTLSPSHKKSPHHHQHLLYSPTRRHPSPLQFPDTNFNTRYAEVSSPTADRETLAPPLPDLKEAEQEMSGEKGPTFFLQTDDSSSTSTGQSTSDHLSREPDHAPSHTPDHAHSRDTDHASSRDDHSWDLDTNKIPSVQSIDSSSHSLPPVPDRLVPSSSTERIMELLNEHGLRTESHGMGMEHVSLSEERKELPLSSTPAAKSPRENDSSINSPLDSSRDFDRCSLTSQLSIPEGTFMGDARHKDGSLMAVLFQLKRITLADGQDICCMWLSRDLDMERARTADFSMSMSRPAPPDPYRHQHASVSPEVDIGGVEDTDGISAQLVLPGPGGGGGHSLWSQVQSQQQQQQQAAEELLAMEGEYSLNYNSLRPVGKGAFGFVRLAQKVEDDSMVVVKFLRKSSVLRDCWINDHEMGVVPLEIALLARLSHGNVVRLLEAYENEHFFQMVMEKHGEGLDLFEFIEKGPRLTEQHVSYLFRQMVAGLGYLHQNDIVHRDVKDENIIIDQHFNIKLIDFGSAAYMAPGKLFNTFCGTLEYCSPEVLLGNSYAGPELEMWALGVTLYTLVFGENPFFDVEETISGHLQPPFLTSPALMKVLFWLLHPDPRSRATIKDLQKDKWTNQAVDEALLNFDTVLGHATKGEVAGGNVRHFAGPPVKSNSVGGAVQLSRSMMDQLMLSDNMKQRGGACL